MAPAKQHAQFQTIGGKLLLASTAILGLVCQLGIRAEEACAITLETEQVNKVVLPFQAVRIRAVLRHDHDGVVKNLPTVGMRSFVRQVDGKLRENKKATAPLALESNDSGCEWGDRDNHYDVYRGEQVAWSYPLSWDGLANAVSASSTALFPKPGKYEIRFRYPMPRKPGKSQEFRESRLIVSVQEPTGDDKIIYEMLRENQELAFELALPIYDPVDNVHDRIREIVEKYPDSSYANFARFALARRHLKGTGYTYWKRGKTTARGEIERYVRKFVERSVTEKKWSEAARKLGESISQRGISGTRLKKVRSALYAAHDKSKREETINALTDMVWVSPADRRAAQRLLLGILDKDFAYYPNVRASLKMSLLGANPDWEKRIDAEMNEKYYDSFVWICMMRHHITQRRPWRDFRVRYVPKPKIGK